MTVIEPGRCAATLRFPAPPYHNLRCRRLPHHPEDEHRVTTTVPTEHVPDSAAAWRKPDMATVTLTWKST